MWGSNSLSIPWIEMDRHYYRPLADLIYDQWHSIQGTVKSSDNWNPFTMTTVGTLSLKPCSKCTCRDEFMNEWLLFMLIIPIPSRCQKTSCLTFIDSSHIQWESLKHILWILNNYYGLMTQKKLRAYFSKLYFPQNSLHRKHMVSYSGTSSCQDMYFYFQKI